MDKILSEIEVEFKSGIHKEKYKKLLNKFLSFGEHILQTNYYFDTLDLKFFRANITIRIREKNDHFRITKKTHVNGQESSSEKSKVISKEQAKEYIIGGLVNHELGITEKLRYITKLKTNRFMFKYHGGTLCLDKSTYGKKMDYEIEYEVEHASQKKYFIKFLQDNNIEYIPIGVKSERAIKEAVSNKII